MWWHSCNAHTGRLEDQRQSNSQPDAALLPNPFPPFFASLRGGCRSGRCISFCCASASIPATRSTQLLSSTHAGL